jgi:hypothetical protein
MIPARNETKRKTRTIVRRKRDKGSGRLTPPRPGISPCWAIQCTDLDGKPLRRSRFPDSGKTVPGEVKPGCDPKLPESWTNITQARLMLSAWIKKVSSSGLSVGNDPFQHYYSDLRRFYISGLADNKRKSLRTRATAGEVNVDSLTHLDRFFRCKKEGDTGVKVNQINDKSITQFKGERKSACASTPPAPPQQFRKAANGIRLSGMPTFKSKLTDARLWQVNELVAHAENLPDSAQKRYSFWSTRRRLLRGKARSSHSAGALA